MISIISPSKSMDFTSPIPEINSLQPGSDIKTQAILDKLQSLSINETMKLMNVSEKIANLNYERMQTYANLPARAAIFAYTGDVYKNIDVLNLSPDMLDFAQKHLHIISALYGALRPLDEIKAYRLEMSIKLPGMAPKGLASLWKEEITERVNKEFAEHKSKVLINIASNEYAAAIDRKKLEHPMINICFRENKNGQLKNIALNAKRARGMLADYIIRNKIDTAEDIKSFDKNGYKFDQTLSDKDNFFFIRAIYSDLG